MSTSTPAFKNKRVTQADIDLISAEIAEECARVHHLMAFLARGVIAGRPDAAAVAQWCLDDGMEPPYSSIPDTLQDELGARIKHPIAAQFIGFVMASLLQQEDGTFSNFMVCEMQAPEFKVDVVIQRATGQTLAEQHRQKDERIAELEMELLTAREIMAGILEKEA